jgi:hypothetical protein
MAVSGTRYVNVYGYTGLKNSCAGNYEHCLRANLRFNGNVYKRESHKNMSQSCKAMYKYRQSAQTYGNIPMKVDINSSQNHIYQLL